jgi:hypothetical protein
MAFPFPRAPPPSNVFPCTFSVTPACFWLVVESKTLIGGYLRPRCIFLIMFLLINWTTKTIALWPSIRSTPAARPTQYITHPGCQLPFDCCIFRKWRPPKANAHPSLYVLMWIKHSSQTRELAVACTNPVPGACNGPMGRCGAKIWGHHCPTHGERGQSHWGAGWWLILLDVELCCVVLCVVLFVASDFWFLATVLVESQHQPRQYGQLLRNHNIIKSAPKDPKYLGQWEPRSLPTYMIHLVFQCLTRSR